MDEKRAFEYSIPYHNQKADIHSSFYYYVIYTASSLVPEAFSKQVGIVPNFLFYLLATVLLFLLSWCISGSPILGVAATMCGAMAHIRIYAMLTVCCWLRYTCGPCGRRKKLGTEVVHATNVVTLHQPQHSDPQLFLVFCFFLRSLGDVLFHLSHTRLFVGGFDDYHDSAFIKNARVVVFKSASANTRSHQVDQLSAPGICVI